MDTTELIDDRIEDLIEDGTQAGPAEPDIAETLIEEVSIDGMCGVY